MQTRGLRIESERKAPMVPRRRRQCTPDSKRGPAKAPRVQTIPARREHACNVNGWLYLHIFAESIAGAILLFQPNIFEPGPVHFGHLEAMRGFGNGAVSVTLVGAALALDGKPNSRTATWLYAILAQYHLGIFVLQCRNPMKGAPVWLAPSFHGILAAAFLLRCVGWAGPGLASLASNKSVRRVGIRSYEKADRLAVLAIFRHGMMTTIVPGLRHKLCRHVYVKVYASFCCLLGWVCRNSPCTLLVFAGVCLVALPVAVLGVVPWYCGRDYVHESIHEKDLKDIEAHYLLRGEKCHFWVAFDEKTGEILGCVALDEIHEGNSDRWNVGDGELRRMSVKASARGAGVATLLIAALIERAKQVGYKRIVLSTSETQTVAVAMYPNRFGFRLVREERIMRFFLVSYFALPLGGKKHF